MVQVQIYERAKKYYYFYWTKKDDDKLQSLFKDLIKIKVWFMNSYLGEKNISMKYRRISIGKNSISLIPKNAKNFILEMNSKGELLITCK